MALTDNLVAYWRLDEASGTRADSSGNGRSLTAIGAPLSRAGKLGDGVDFVTASSQRLEISAASLGSVLVRSADWTIAGWVLTDTTGTFQEVWGQFDGSLRGPLGRYNGSGNFVVQWLNSVFSSFSATSTVTASASTWYFYAAWHDIAAGKIYVSVNRETAVASASLTGTFNNSTCPFALGQRAGTGGSLATYQDGGWDAVGIWSRALTSGELDQLYNSGAGLDPTASTGSALPLFAAQLMAMR